jgi:hypothetical protein
MSQFVTNSGTTITGLSEMRKYVERCQAQLALARSGGDRERCRRLITTASDAEDALERWEAAEAAGREYSFGENSHGPHA